MFKITKVIAASEPTTIPPVLVNCHTMYDMMPINPIKPAFANHSIIFANVLPLVLCPDAICIMPIVEMMKSTLVAAVIVINKSTCLNSVFTSINKINAANVVPPRNALTFNALVWNELSFDINSISYEFSKYLYFHCVLLVIITNDHRSSFLLVIFSKNRDLGVAQGKKIERCAYCASKKITHPKSISIRRAITFFLNSWSSQDNTKIRIERCECVCCQNPKCGRSYQKTKTDRKKLLEINAGLKPADSGMVEYKQIFHTNNLNGWLERVIEVVEPIDGVLHIIFRMCKIKAYLDCQKSGGRFVIVGVEVIR